jgi:hypothetical protein
MRDLPALTPALAQQVWDAMPNPSTRRVARKLRQAGTAISHETINRWRRAGWRPLERTQHPLERAREALDDALPVLTGDPLTTTTNLVAESNEHEKLEPLSDAQHLKRAVHEIAKDTVVVATVLLQQADRALAKPAEFGVLLQGLAACLQAVAAGFTQAQSMSMADAGTRPPD